MAKSAIRRQLLVFAHWQEMAEPQLMGTLLATPVRGKEVFAFEYARSWLASLHAQRLDPSLQLYAGLQYVPAEDQGNFGLFLDSAPDRWGRLLMRRREAALARLESRPERTLLESDYLLGVFDAYRMGGLRFKSDPAGPFLNDNQAMAAPPWTSLRELEHASLQLERAEAADDPDYLKWLALLIAPGSSLGGARPKASVVDQQDNLWIAKFPSGQDEHDVGGWEAVVNVLAERAGLEVAVGRAQRFASRHHTYLSQRFDRTLTGQRRHFASAMTLLGYQDGINHQDGASYLELAELLMAQGARVAEDLTELWRRIVFNICVSNTDDHLRNHGFLLTSAGWQLAPAYDLNPIPFGQGLRLNISETDNALSLDLAREVAPYFRLKPTQAQHILSQIVAAVQPWRRVAEEYQLGREEQERMQRAFTAARL
ncbi:type II toxin-antitoxin system HipA family toxin [Hymenobacter arizonensis]|uniref:Serine/threonine-protein kinase HipA n=1 Tax=Hymenobacter arizonensis TaxID=1227077 RepID=A0A1I6BF19_HYMAR|nr:HipA domain-containing protein [Hymenobacter arizonensis]SFQ79504.1 serine/threonine-protein kinase HipA [Hymenobacter arizonensis]